MPVVNITASHYRELQQILDRENLDDVATVIPFLIYQYQFHSKNLSCPHCGHDERDNCMDDTPDLIGLSK